METPHVGQAVHYRPPATPNGEYQPDCRAALVTAAGGWQPVSVETARSEGVRTRTTIERWTSRVATLTVLDPAGIHIVTAAPYAPVLVDPDGIVHVRGGTWHIAGPDCP